MKLKIKIERELLMSGFVSVERCMKLVSEMRYLKAQYCIIEDGVLFTMEPPANFSFSIVDNMTDAMRFYLDGHEVGKDLREMSTRTDKPVRII